MSLIPSSHAHAKAVDILLNAGADIESTTDQLFTPLLVATYNGKLQLAKRLVKAGANLEAKNKQQYTAVCVAAQQGHADILGFLVDRSAGHQILASNVVAGLV